MLVQRDGSVLKGKMAAERLTPRMPAPAALAVPRGSWLGRLLGRNPPTVYHRCLAVHIHHAARTSALS
jgi:hypothetical protein